LEEKLTTKQQDLNILWDGNQLQNILEPSEGYALPLNQHNFINGLTMTLKIKNLNFS